MGEGEAVDVVVEVEWWWLPPPHPAIESAATSTASKGLRTGYLQSVVEEARAQRVSMPKVSLHDLITIGYDGD